MRYLLPIAAPDQLFPREEYHFPKPLIEIDTVPMIALVIDSIKRRDPEAEFIFVANRDDCAAFSLDQTLILSAGPGTRVVQLDKPTAGALCSCLMAIDLINDDKPLTILNGDQIFLADFMPAIRKFEAEGVGAGVVVFDSVHPRWSYVRVDEGHKVIEAAEKRVISRKAIAGFYYFKSGATFVEAAKQVMLNGQALNGRYYISPTLNQVILNGDSVGQYEIAAEDYQSFYSPQRVEHYQSLSLARRAAAPKSPQALQVVIPMAGLGSRFASAGYDKPKPFIDVAGKTMIERVMDNLRIPNSRFVLIARDEHLQAEPLVKQNLEALGYVTFSSLDFVTEGAACTVLTARRELDLDAPLLIANCDQIVDFDCQAFIQAAQARDLDGSILVFKDAARDPKWSFAKVDTAGFVLEVKEKMAISDNATVGLYYFRRAGDFVDAALDMISRKDRVNNEFYVCPVYNYLIRDHKKVGVHFVSPTAMHGIGTPEDLNAYLAQSPAA